MSLLDTYVSNLKNIPKKNRVFVMRHRGHDCLAPSEKLFRDFKEREKELRKNGLAPEKAHNQAYQDVRFEERFSKEFWNNSEAVEKLTQIKKLSESEDVYLVCYEKSPKKCHRSLLVEYAKKL